jgi:ABC-type nickel/cobalt efflux system permease component RcnA
VVIVLQAKVPVEEQPTSGPPAPVGRANTIGGVFALLTLALGLVVIWSQLRARGRKFIGHRRHRSRHHSAHHRGMKLSRWRRSAEEESEHHLA